MDPAPRSTRALHLWPYLVGLAAVMAIFEVTTRTRDWFRVYPNVDIPLHLGWGAVVALIVIVFLRNHRAWVLGLVLAWQAVWEASEQIGDRIIEQPAYMHDPLIWDGLIDTGFDLLGAVIVIALTAGTRRSAAVAVPAPTGSEPPDDRGR